MNSSLRALCGVLAIALGLVLPGRVFAHQVLPSVLELSLRPGAVDATLHLPASELGLALAAEGDRSLERLAETPERFDDVLAERVRTYVAANLYVEDERGARYALDVGAPRWTTENDQAFVVVEVALAAPDAHTPTQLRVHDEVISEEVISHRTLVAVTHDFERAELERSDRIVSMLRHYRPEFTIDRSGASTWNGVKAMLELGARHIAEGLDHLLFVFVLLLPAPLLTEGTGRKRRWAEPRSLAATLRGLAGIVTAFTLGHSVTLALGVLGWVRVPSTPVETLVGLSIALGAVNALRPIFGGREPWVAGLFGLVHGLAFASTLEGFGLRGSALGLALGAFNVGIELVQLAVVLVVAPLLVLAARSLGYAWLRGVLASGALVAAGAWVTERLVGAPNPLSTWLADAAAQPAWVFAVALGALAAWLVVVRVARAVGPLAARFVRARRVSRRSSRAVTVG